MKQAEKNLFNSILNVRAHTKTHSVPLQCYIELGLSDHTVFPTCTAHWPSNPRQSVYNCRYCNVMLCVAGLWICARVWSTFSCLGNRGRKRAFQKVPELFPTCLMWLEKVLNRGAFSEDETPSPALCVISEWDEGHTHTLDFVDGSEVSADGVKPRGGATTWITWENDQKWKHERETLMTWRRIVLFVLFISKVGREMMYEEYIYI